MSVETLNNSSLAIKCENSYYPLYHSKDKESGNKSSNKSINKMKIIIIIIIASEAWESPKYMERHQLIHHMLDIISNESILHFIPKYLEINWKRNKKATKKTRQILRKGIWIEGNEQIRGCFRF